MLDISSYFCNPYHSWEKGTVENTIGLTQRWLPKKTYLAKVSEEKIVKIENWLNIKKVQMSKLKVQINVKVQN